MECVYRALCTELVSADNTTSLLKTPRENEKYIPHAAFRQRRFFTQWHSVEHFLRLVIAHSESYTLPFGKDLPFRTNEHRDRVDGVSCDYLRVAKLHEEGLRDLHLQVIEAEQVLT